MITEVSFNNTQKPVKSENSYYKRIFSPSADKLDITFSASKMGKHAQKIQQDLQKEQKLKELSRLKNEQSYAVLIGTFADFRKAREAYAKEAIKDFDAAKAASGMKITNIPLTSKLGLKIMYFWIRGFFTKKTHEEKTLQQQVKLDKMVKKYCNKEHK